MLYCFLDMMEMSIWYHTELISIKLAIIYTGEEIVRSIESFEAVEPKLS